MIKRLSETLTEQYRRGFSVDTLENTRRFFLTHQDLGQMLMYVHYYDRYEKLPEENPTVGILLCKEKDDALVEITLPDDSNIYASEYQLYLPDKKELQKKLKEWIDEGTDL